MDRFDVEEKEVIITDPKLKEEVENDAIKDWASKIAGFLSALLPIVALFGINLEWFNEDFINNVYVMIVAIGLLGMNIFTIWKNHFVTKKAKKQNAVLKQKGLKE